MEVTAAPGVSPFAGAAPLLPAPTDVAAPPAGAAVALEVSGCGPGPAGPLEEPAAGDAPTPAGTPPGRWLGDGVAWLGA
ncbi:MAG TPA: hypothetical protein PLF56_08830, partial [Micropruina sp.]|nr:hypothetical protein [Micropruina sp.]